MEFKERIQFNGFSTGQFKLYNSSAADFIPIMTSFGKSKIHCKIPLHCNIKSHLVHEYYHLSIKGFVITS